jgi:flagellar hook-length control protein FliK
MREFAIPQITGPAPLKGAQEPTQMLVLGLKEKGSPVDLSQNLTQGAPVPAAPKETVAEKAMPLPLSGKAAASLTGQEILQNLSRMKLPVTETNIKLAQSMLEYRVPLNLENLINLRNALANLAEKHPMDMPAASFLMLNQIPLTPQNLTSLSYFMTYHPMLGEQLFQLQGYCKELATKNSKLDFAAQIPTLLAKYILQPQDKTKQEIMNHLYRLAQNLGAEVPGINQENDLQQFLQQLKAGLGEHTGTEEAALLKAFELITGLERNLSAQKLLNQSQDQQFPWVYLQVPLNLKDELHTLELKIYRDKAGEAVEDEELRLEFKVKTEALGELEVKLRTCGKVMQAVIGSSFEAAQEFMTAYLAKLRKNLEALGYKITKLESVLVGEEAQELIPREALEELERFDYTA